MKNLLKQIALVFRDLVYKIRHKRTRSLRKKRLRNWREIDRNETLLLDYNLFEDSIAFDLGCYKGQWTADIYDKYKCTIHCFEPVAEFAKNCKERFSGNSKIFVYQCGLAESNKILKISHTENASSLFHGRGVEEICLIEGTDFMEKHKISRIDLMKINIEGGEYDLLEHFIDTAFVSKIVNIQVQFHDFVPKAKRRLRNLQQRLNETHKTTYQVDFVWENWQLRG